MSIIPTQFNPRTLSRAVEEIKTAVTLVVSMVFGEQIPVDQKNLEFDVIHDTERILASKSSAAEAVVSESGKETHVVVSGGRFPLKRFISAGDLANLREPGTLSPRKLTTHSI